jgi:tetratricopeptide (TPR) repeat protein
VYKRSSEKRFIGTFFLSMFFLLWGTIAYSQTKEQCDSLIKKGSIELFRKDYVKSLELFTQARAIAENKHWDRQLYNAVFNIGNNYYALLDFGEALNYYLESYTIAVKKLQPKDEIAALNNIANLYTKEKMYDKAMEYYSKAYVTANEKNIDSRKGLPLMNIGYLYSKMNEPEKGRPYLIQSMQYLEDDHLLGAKIALIENDMLLGKIKKSREDALALYKSATDKSIDIYLWQIISKGYIKKGNYAMAEKYALEVLSKNIEPDLKRDVFELLALIYSKSKKYEKAVATKDSIININKRINELKNGRVFENNRVRFEIQNYRNDIKDKEDKIHTERIVFISSLGILLAFIIIVLLFFRQKNIIAERNKNAAALNLEKEKNHSLILEKQITDALLEQERLKNEIENRNRKLSAKALYLSDRNEMIEEIVTYLSKKPKYSSDKTLSEYVRSLKNNLRTDNEWNNFITHFEEVNHGFLTRLKELHPTLTANDIRFIAYIYMNLTIKEMASILNITIVACKKRKERLAAKMDITKDLDLFDYISTL